MSLKEKNKRYLAKQKFSEGDTSLNTLLTAEVSIKPLNDLMSIVINNGFRVYIQPVKGKQLYFIEYIDPKGNKVIDDQLFTKKREEEMYKRYRYILAYIILTKTNKHPFR